MVSPEKKSSKNKPKQKHQYKTTANNIQPIGTKIRVSILLNGCQKGVKKKCIIIKKNNNNYIYMFWIV